jgi:hypothetical protein
MAGVLNRWLRQPVKVGEPVAHPVRFGVHGSALTKIVSQEPTMQTSADGAAVRSAGAAIDWPCLKKESPCVRVLATHDPLLDRSASDDRWRTTLPHTYSHEGSL